MLKPHVLIAIALVLIGSARAEDRPTYQSLWSEATAKPNNTIKEYPDLTLVFADNDLTLYYFTKPNHPAHPGVIERIVTQVGGAIYVREKGWSFAPDSAQPAFIHWLDQIKELDRQMKTDLQRRKP